ncbi:hypothetical protein TNCV_1038081 [Trichonephila clavipes]|nr:hypothetical protein TNCV_1038081 [Trichonephila clavipes]
MLQLCENFWSRQIERASSILCDEDIRTQKLQLKSDNKSCKPLVDTRLPWPSVDFSIRLPGPDKLDLTRFFGYKFRSTCSKEAYRSSAPRARNELKLALPCPEKKLTN